MDKKSKKLPMNQKRLHMLSLVVFIFILGLVFFSLREDNPLQMGSAMTTDALEMRWSQEYNLFLPGIIEKININTADQETLEALPGVGEKLAKAIIVYREKDGLFQAVDEVVKVSGIGLKKLNQMKEFITVE